MQFKLNRNHGILSHAWETSFVTFVPEWKYDVDKKKCIEMLRTSGKRSFVNLMKLNKIDDERS